MQSSRFEVTLPGTLLNEGRRPTSVDWLLGGDRGVLAVEAKFTERGLGRCSCPRRAEGQCSDAVLARPYWTVAQQQLGWSRAPGPCPVSLAYQGVRNVAAAHALAGEERVAGFGLLYDARNPYFAGTGSGLAGPACLRRRCPSRRR